MTVTLIMHVIFVAAVAVHIVGVRMDYRNSLGRGEQNPDYQDEHGYFSPAKFRRVAVRFFILIVASSLVFEFLLSRGTPQYAYSLLIGVGALLFTGIQGIALSRR